MQRQFAGLAKLSVADGERAINGVKISAIETDRFPDTHSRYRQ